jgi:alpha-mannosidase
VLAEAEDLNQPLSARAVDAGAESTWTAAAISGLDLGLCGFKPAEDGRGLVLRAYEPAGARGTVAMALADGWRLAGEVDLLEEPLGAADRAFTPFQIHSWRIEKGAP